MPNRPIFSQLFARSPISPIQEHMKIAHDAVSELPAFFDAAFGNDWDAASKIYDQISELESEADKIKREVRTNLPRSIFMPVSRTDLLELVHIQDKIPNGSQDVAGRCLGRQLQYPAVIHGLMKDYVSSVSATVSAALKAMNELDEVLETGFSGNEVSLIEGMISDLNNSESKTDVLQREVRAGLFKEEDGMNPIDVMFMYAQIATLGDIADDAQAVGNRLLCLIAK